MRNEVIVTIKDGEQDLKFRIRQMSATQRVEFASKVTILLGASPDGPGVVDRVLTGDGITVGSLIGLMGGVDYAKMTELTDKLLACCSRIIEGESEQQCSATLIDGYINDHMTIFQLYKEAVAVNFPTFSLAGMTQPENPSASPAKVHLGKPRKKSEQPMP